MQVDYSMLYKRFLNKEMSFQEFFTATSLRLALFYPVNQSVYEAIQNTNSLEEINNFSVFLENELFDLDIVEHVISVYLYPENKAEILQSLQDVRELIKKSQYSINLFKQIN